MKAGELVHRIALLEPQPAVIEASGTVRQAFADRGEVSARIVTVKGKEALRQAAMQATRSLRIGLRWRGDVTVRWRLVWRGDVYEVTHVDRSGRHRDELWLEAEARGVGSA